MISPESKHLFCVVIYLQPVILHSDLNSFYASVECALRPELRDKPVAVCGSIEARHGIILAKNPLAKCYGIKTGLAVWEARRLCPDLVTVEARHEIYLRYARRVRSIYTRFTPWVEPFGLDEAWLDVTGEDGKTIADRIRRTIYEECGITASIGVADNKIYAKLGSDYKKPDATTVFLAEAIPKVVYKLPVSDLLFCGNAATRRLHSYRIETIGDLARADPIFLHSILGKTGVTLGQYAKGVGLGPVRKFGDEESIKSIGHSTTLPRDITTDEDARAVIALLSDAVGTRLRSHRLCGRTVSLYLRYSDLSHFERQTTLPTPTNLSLEIRDAAFRLLSPMEVVVSRGLGLRSVGVRLSELVPENEEYQLTLTGQPYLREKRIALDHTMDDLRRRFGYLSLRRASMLRDPSLTGLDFSKDAASPPDPHLT